MKKISLLVLATVVGLVSLCGSALGHEATKTLNAKHEHNHDHDHDHDHHGHLVVNGGVILTGCRRQL